MRHIRELYTNSTGSCLARLVVSIKSARMLKLRAPCCLYVGQRLSLGSIRDSHSDTAMPRVTMLLSKGFNIERPCLVALTYSRALLLPAMPLATCSGPHTFFRVSTIAQPAHVPLNSSPLETTKDQLSHLYGSPVESSRFAHLIRSARHLLIFSAQVLSRSYPRINSALDSRDAYTPVGKTLLYRCSSRPGISKCPGGCSRHPVSSLKRTVRWSVNSCGYNISVSKSACSRI